jgi:GNAT superfamily N-acetyltransferase
MEITRDDRLRMERAHVAAWPALRTANIDGWLWRSSGGGSQRANSVSTIDFNGNDLEAAIDAVENRYRALGAPTRFQTFDETEPRALPDALRRLGYSEGEPTQTMFRRPTPIAAAPQVEIRDSAWDEWEAVYMGAITEDRRLINSAILTGAPGPRAFFGCHDNGRIISTALCVVGYGCAVVECVATRTDARRQAGAARVMLGLLDWAAQQGVDMIGLQVVTTNMAAVRLYASLGFVAGATNRFWLK